MKKDYHNKHICPTLLSFLVMIEKNKNVKDTSIGLHKLIRMSSEANDTILHYDN